MTEKPAAPKPPVEAKPPEAPAAEEARLHPVLTNVEVRAAQAKARERIEAQRRKQATDKLVEEETRRLELEEGLTSGDPVADEIVSITIDMAEFADRIHINQPGGPIYLHGHTYTVPRHVANTLAEIMWRTHQHQAEIKGDGRLNAYKRSRDTVLSAVKGTTNAPRPMNA